MVKSKRKRNPKILSHTKSNEDKSTIALNRRKSGHSEQRDLIDWTQPKPYSHNIFEIIYRRYPLAFRGVHIRANEAMARGYQIVHSDEKVVEEVEDFFEETNFDDLLYQIFVDTNVFGNGYLEIIYNEDESNIAGLVLINPKSIEFFKDRMGRVLFDSDGLPEGYQQGSYKNKVKLLPDQVAHFTFHRLGDDLVGMSLFEPCAKTVEIAMNVERDVAQAIHRHGYAQFSIAVGDESHQPTEKQINKIATDVEDLQVKNEYVHAYYIKPEVLEAKNTRSYESYATLFVKQIVSCLGVPEPLLLGTGEGTNKATADVQSKHFRASIEADQLAVKRVVEKKILKKMAELRGWDEIPRIEWNEVLPEEESAKVGRVATLVDKGVVTRSEAREMLGLPPMPFADEDFQEESTGEETRGQPPVIVPERLPEKEATKIEDPIEKSKKNVLKEQQMSKLKKRAQELMKENNLRGGFE